MKRYIVGGKPGDKYMFVTVMEAGEVIETRKLTQDEYWKWIRKMI